MIEEEVIQEKVEDKPKKSSKKTVEKKKVAIENDESLYLTLKGHTKNVSCAAISHSSKIEVIKKIKLLQQPQKIIH